MNVLQNRHITLESEFIQVSRDLDIIVLGVDIVGETILILSDGSHDSVRSWCSSFDGKERLSVA